MQYKLHVKVSVDCYCLMVVLWCLFLGVFLCSQSLSMRLKQYYPSLFVKAFVPMCLLPTIGPSVAAHHHITHFGRLQRHVQKRRMLVHHHKVDLSWLISIAEHLQLVDARQQDAPEFAVARRLEADVTSLDLQRCPFDWRSGRVHHETLDASVGLRQELDQRQLIVLPVFPKLVRRRKLAAAHLERDLHAAVPYVVVVLCEDQT